MSTESENHHQKSHKHKNLNNVEHINAQT